MSVFKKCIPTCLSPSKSPPKKTMRNYSIDHDEDMDEYTGTSNETTNPTTAVSGSTTSLMPSPSNAETQLNELYGITNKNIIEFENNTNRLITVEMFYAYLCYLITICESVAIAISPQYTKMLQEREGDLPKIEQFMFGDVEKYEIAIIPIINTERFAVGIYDRYKSVRYFDPIGDEINGTIRGHLQFVIQQLNNNQVKTRVYQAKNHTYNKAESEQDTGIHCCSIVRRFLMEKRETAAIDFDVSMEKQQIIDELRNALNGNSANLTQEREDLRASSSRAAIRMRMLRRAESDEETEERLRNERERRRISREGEGMEETKERRQRVLEAYHKKKQIRSPYFQQGRIIDDNQKPHQLSDMNTECVHCRALHFTEETTAKSKNTFNDCCRHGKIQLDPLNEPPELLRVLFDGTHQWSKKFFDNIRRINSSLSFASLNPIPQRMEGRGPRCLKIQGQITFLLNAAVLPDPNEQPSYGQLYIVDSKEARDIRLIMNPSVDPDLLEALSDEIKAHNQIAQSYVMMVDEYKRQEEIAKKEKTEVPAVRLIFHIGDDLDQRRYNMPQTNEIAAVFVPGSDNEVPETTLVVHPIGKDLHPMKSTNPLVDPMIYPLFFPYGEVGWNLQLQHVNSRKTVSRAEYASYRLFPRNNEFNTILRGRDLLQMFCAEYSIRVLNDRMNFIRSNQKKVRADLYKNIDSQMQKRARDSGLPLGRKIILPSSITGTPRWEAEQFADAMTMVMEIGKPDIFITMTCNPAWPEITNNLLPGQCASDRPDLVARVFDLKKDAMIQLIMNGLLGEVCAFVYVIEWQSRGLPHCHALFTLEKESKMRTATEVDFYISAQIPDYGINARLYSLVEKHMLHGPHKMSSDGRVDCPCYKPDKKTGKMKCRFKFPKDYAENTILDESGYPTYARPNNDRNIVKRGITLDNRWVVPFNPYLLLAFDCHINVERVFDISSIKYMYKYIYKGPDRTKLHLQSEPSEIIHDEISRYIDGRYVSAPEGVWHILRKKVQHKSHTIVRLPVHLEDEQTVCFSEDANEEEIEQALLSRKMLTDYFNLNTRDPEACKLYYHQIPHYYVWKKNKWDRRLQHFNTIGRMQHVQPSDGDRFYLRLLLCNVKGAKTFKELFEVEGIVHQSYKSACLAHGLIQDNSEWIKAMDEAKSIALPNALRVFFARLLVHCNPADPADLWDRYKEALSEDFKKELDLNEDITPAIQRAYQEIARLMSEEGKPLSHFDGMPIILNDQFEVEEAVDVETAMQKGMEMYSILNDEQKKIVENILNRLKLPLPESADSELQDISNMVFVDGPGGTGKTTVYQVLNQILVGNGKKVYNAAFSGIAAILLPSGRTIHNLFGLPVPLYAESTSNIGPTSKAWDELRATDVFMLDEASMIPKHAIRAINDLMQEITGNLQPFGGKLFIFGGDFRQTLPIQRHATRAQQIDLCLKSSPLWARFSQFKLKKNMRALEEEKDYAQWLLKVGNGKNDEVDFIILPKKCICHGDLEDEIFSAPIARKDWVEVGKRAILAPLNVDVDEINEKVVKMIQGEEIIYKSIDGAVKFDSSNVDSTMFPNEFLQSLKPQGFAPHELKLKKHCIVMLIRNLNIRRGLSNGTRFEVIGMHRHLIECKVIGGNNAGQIELIPRITLSCSDQYPFILNRHQFPLRLSFAFTINKSQGQTLEKVGIDLRTEVFAHGQLYTAVSRSRSFDSVKVLLNEGNEERKVKNIVYEEILDIDKDDENYENIE